MVVYIVMETCVYDYSDGKEHVSIYGVYQDRSTAELAAIDCRNQVAGVYTVEIQEYAVIVEE